MTAALRLVVGVDPGVTGALVALDADASPVEWWAADDPSGGYVHAGELDAGAVAGWLAELRAEDRAILRAVVERQQARPGEGRSTLLGTGRRWGQLLGVLAALRVPVVQVPPATWRGRVLGKAAAGQGKAAAVAFARARVPDLPLTLGKRRKPHDGLADAACLALYGLREEV
jgi:crossover junction endodeoxyribonuclease RuvC